jgi:hypothetical protein
VQHTWKVVANNAESWEFIFPAVTIMLEGAPCPTAMIKGDPICDVYSARFHVAGRESDCYC